MYTLWVKKDQRYFQSITLPNVGQIEYSFIIRFSKEFAIKWLSLFPPHLNYVATLPCEKSMPKFLHIQHNNVNLLVIFYQTNTLKCTNVESAVRLNNKKVVLLHEHTLIYITRL